MTFQTDSIASYQSELPVISPAFQITSKTTFYNDQPHYNINKNTNKNLENSEISEISEKIQRVAKLSKYVKMLDKSLKLTQLKQIK